MDSDIFKALFKAKEQTKQTRKTNGTPLRAIETIYKGCRFRSRLEARWAVVFDELDIQWEYEPEGFILPDGTWYLPDFYLRDEEWFVEVKPDRPLTDDERNKVNQLDDFVINGGDYPSQGCLVTPSLDFIKKEANTGDFYLDLQTNKLFFQRIMPLNKFWNYSTANNAIAKGRQARFEHGEKG